MLRTQAVYLLVDLQINQNKRKRCNPRLSRAGMWTLHSPLSCLPKLPHCYVSNKPSISLLSPACHRMLLLLLPGAWQPLRDKAQPHAAIAGCCHKVSRLQSNLQGWFRERVLLAGLGACPSHPEVPCWGSLVLTQVPISCSSKDAAERGH